MVLNIGYTLVLTHVFWPEQKQIHRQINSIGCGFKLVWEVRRVHKNWRLTLSGRLELEFGDIHYDIDGRSPLAPTYFERCHTFSS